MNFESINVTSLRQALYDCKNSLNHSFSDEFVAFLSGDSWLSDSKRRLIDAITLLTKERYSELNQKIDSYLNLTNMIEEYQNLNKRNSDANNRISELKPHLWRSEKYTESRLKSDGTYEYIDHWHDVEDVGVKNEISSLSSDISNNLSQMDILKSKISNLI